MELTITVSEFDPEKVNEIKTAIQGLFPGRPDSWRWDVWHDYLEGTFGGNYFDEGLGDQIAKIAKAIWVINEGYCGVRYEVLELISVGCGEWDQEDYESRRKG